MMFDKIHAEIVEFVVDGTGKIWLNVDGACVARIGNPKMVVVQTPKASQKTGDFILERKS